MKIHVASVCLIAVSFSAVGCGAQRAKQAELQARRAQERAMVEAERARKAAEQAQTQLKEKESAAEELDRLRQENQELKRKLARAEQTQTGQKKEDSTPAHRFTHTVAKNAVYYTNGPQQGRTPDGEFAAGTKVVLVGKAGSYVFVKSQSDVEAFVAKDALTEIAVKPPSSEVVEGANRFAWELYQKLKSQKGTLFCSPASITTALAMTHAGARGATEKEIAATLHLPDQDVHEAMRAYQRIWRSTSGDLQLSLANRLWAQQGFDMESAFLRTTREQYGAQVARLDFSKTEQARGAINGWVQEQTKDKIKDLIPKGALPGNARLVLTNAVYFYGIWQHPFKKELTKDADFYVAGGQSKKTPMMHRSGKYHYGEFEHLQTLAIPYGDGGLSMVIFLPKKRDGLAELEPQLTARNVGSWTTKMNRERVRVYLPRFKTTAQFDLGGTLEAMGMRTAFDPNAADFSGITGGRDLYISAVIHQAMVDVNEKGTEAAAATAVTLEPTAAPIEPPKQPFEFRADHPFVMAIRHNRTGAILFLGRITDPSSGE